MKPFILITTRPEAVVSKTEYRAFMRMGGLNDKTLLHHRLDQAPLPDIDLADYSGIMVGGSPFDVKAKNKSETQIRVEAELSELVHELIEADFPFFGACYGIALLGVQKGATIGTTYGEEMGPVTVTLTEAGRQDPITAGMPSVFQSYTAHNESCDALAPTTVLLATGENCPVQMFRVRNNLYGTQFHAEVDWPGMQERIEYYAHKYSEGDATQRIWDNCEAADVRASEKLISNFTALHARPA